MKTAELLETLRTRQPLSWRQVRDRLPLSLPRQSRLDLASDDRYQQESDYGGGSAIVDFLDMKDGWAGPGTFAPSRMIIRNARLPVPGLRCQPYRAMRFPFPERNHQHHLLSG